MVVALLVVLVAWAGLTSPLGSADARPLIDPIVLPSPLAVMRALQRLAFESSFPRDVALTVMRFMGALTIAVAVGVPLGLVLATSRRLYGLVEAPLHAMRSVPSAALFPLFLIVIGIGNASLVALATYNSLMVIVIATTTGAFLANSRRLYQARLLGLGRFTIAIDVLFWEALPHTLNGMRVAVGYALALTIAAEMFIGTSQAGVGRKIFDFQAAYRMPETYAAILVAAVIGVAANWLVTACERRLLRWLPHAQQKAWSRGSR